MEAELANPMPHHDRHSLSSAHEGHGATDAVDGPPMRPPPPPRRPPLPPAPVVLGGGSAGGGVAAAAAASAMRQQQQQVSHAGSCASLAQSDVSLSGSAHHGSIGSASAAGGHLQVNLSDMLDHR